MSLKQVSNKKSSKNVFGSDCKLNKGKPLTNNLKSLLNKRNKFDGLKFLKMIPDRSITTAFLDPQYRGILDKMGYGNEGKTRGRKRSELPQMGNVIITEFAREIERVLVPSGHLFLWMDKFHLLNGFKDWFTETTMEIVDMVIWDKGKIGMGYRTRRCTEYLVILQKYPKKAKNVWCDHSIRDIQLEKTEHRDVHTHSKPIQLQSRLIQTVTPKNGIVLDPAAGSFSVMESALIAKRSFLGCDING